MYFEYWHLQKPPFDNVPDPSMYAECHVSMENAIAETLFAIEEGNECLAVIIGDVGLGKTLSLRIIIDSLSPEKYQIVLITNPSITFVQLLNEIIGQLTESQCNEKRKMILLDNFNKLLFQTADAGKKIVLLIDEANAIAPANLESLRLLTNMQDDQRNLFTMVLAGQIELARRLEHPKRANLFQRIGTYSQIEKIAQDQLQTYVETRLRLAGATRSIFTEETFPLFWNYSDHGVPRLINKIAKLSLKAGETYGLDQIDARVVYQVGRQFEKITDSAASRGKSKKKKEDHGVTEVNKPLKDLRAPEASTEIPVFPGLEQPGKLAVEPIMNQNFPDEPASEESRELLIKKENSSDSLWSLASPLPHPIEEGRTFLPVAMETIEKSFLPESDQKTGPAPEAEGSAGSKAEDRKATETPDQNSSQTHFSQVPEGAPPTSEGLFEEIQVGKFKIQLHLPSQFIEQALSSNREYRLKMAGLAAAQAIKKFSELTSSPASDPVSIWSELRSIIFKRLDPSESGMVV
jgi:type II secretory pathway predicted ATPase ExeA